MPAAETVTRVDLVLVNGAVRALDVPAGASSIANALSRLDDWIETADDGWVQKSHVVEVRTTAVAARAGAASESEARDAAAGNIAEAAGRDKSRTG